MRNALVAGIFASFVAVACSGSVSAIGPDDGGGGGSDGASGKDAGHAVDGGGCTAVPIHCAPPCPGMIINPTCENGTWVCLTPAIACQLDAGHHGDGGVACGGHTCDAATSYCQNDNGGAHPLDGGSSSTFTCTPYPSCDGGAPTCACVKGNSGCDCADVDGAITVTCNFP